MLLFLHDWGLITRPPSRASTSRTSEKQGAVKWRGREERHMVRHVFSQEKPVGDLEMVMAFDGPMPTGVSLSHSGRIFVNFPRLDDPTAFTAAEPREEPLHPSPPPETQRADCAAPSS